MKLLSSAFSNICELFQIREETYESSKDFVRAKIVLGVQLIYMIAWIFYIGLYYSMGSPINGLICLFVGLPSVFFGIYFFIKTHNIDMGALISSGTALITLAVLTITTGGVQSPILGWIIAVIIVTFLQTKRRFGIVFTILTIQIILLLFMTELWVDELPYYLPFTKESSAYNTFTMLTQSAIVLTVVTSTLVYSNLVSSAFKESQYARDRAQQAAQVKGDFMAMMSHEIRTPMNVMMGMISLLEDTSLDSEQRRCLKTLSYSVDGLTTIVNDVLDFSRLEAMRLDIEKERFNIRDLLDGISEMFGIRVREKNLNFTVMVDHTVPQFITSDPGRIRQILINFIGNALKFTESGHISLSVIVLSHGNFEQTIRFAVEDSGIGIPESKMERIFQPFEQLDSSINRKYGGTGLGLTICKRLTELMGGTIDFTSVENSGTTFYIDLPVSIDIKDAAKQKQLSSINIYHRSKNDSEQNQIREFALYHGARYFSIDETFRLTPESNSILIEDETVQSSTQNMARIVLTSKAVKHIEKLDDTTVLLQKPLTASLLKDGIKIVLNRKDEEPPAEIISEKKVSTGESILLVEDNPYNQKVASKMLEKFEYRVTVASNGAEAVEIFQSSSFDLILMDMQMPEMNGLQASKIIRDLERENCYTPIVAMTANVLDQDRERCYDAGMNDHLAKPFRRDDLLRVIEKNLPLKKVTA